VSGIGLGIGKGLRIGLGSELGLGLQSGLIFMFLSQTVYLIIGIQWMTLSTNHTL